MRSVLLILISTAAIVVVAGFLTKSQPEHVRLLTGTSDCTTSGCHSDLIDVEFTHEAAEEDCETCHDAGSGDHPEAEGPEFSVSDVEPDLCYMCHDEKNTLSVIHDPVGEGDCSACHSPHGSDEPALLLESMDLLCGTCHDAADDAALSQHGPVAGGQCNECHNPHESNELALLTDSSPGLCLGCHDEAQQEITLESVHEAFEDDCLNCHLPHTAAVSPLLSEDIPGLCFQCHDDVEEDIAEKLSVHPPLQESRNCGACHSPHASPYVSQLISEAPQLCFDCHAAEAGKEVKSVQEKITQSAYVHAPADDGECADCHAPHASDNFALLTGIFPEGNYAPGEEDSFALCFDCHDVDLLEVQTTVTATEFRDGSVNLHYVHINQEKGRSCKLCHDTHGSDNPFQIAQTVPFGKWNMPLNFRLTDTGGSCSPGCHTEVSYDNTKDE